MNKKILQMIARESRCFSMDETETSQKGSRLIDNEKAMNVKSAKLIAVGVAVATCCIPSLEYQVNAAREAGASSIELDTAVKIGKMIRQAPMEKIDQRCEQLGI
jgi:alkylhydroperoxidase/carboxymuconolactone decarboxylase family protein YurZ